MKKQSYILIILVFTGLISCDNRSVKNSKTDTTQKTSTVENEKLPDDWSDFYYCDNLDSALKYPDKVHHLTLCNYNLTKLPKDIISLVKIEDITFIQCYNLKWSITFSNLSKLTTLNKIEILECCVRELPKEISKLKQIRSLICVRDSCLRTISNGIVQLDSLRELIISGTFQYFPMQILELKNLKTLDFSFSGLSVIPENIDKLQNLDTLILCGNKINELPKSIVNIKNLKFLNIRGTPIEQRSDYIKTLKSKMPNCEIEDCTTPLKYL